MITTHKERRYNEENEESYALIDALPQLIWVIRPDGFVAYTNQHSRDYNGLLTPYSSELHYHPVDGYQSFQERLQTPRRANMLSDYAFWPENLHPEDRELDLMLRHQAFATGEPYSTEYRLRDGRSGAYRWFLAQVAPQRNKTGEITLWMVSCTDIDDQKQIEERLRQSQECMDLLMNSSIIGVTIADKETFIDANDTFLHMTGYSRQDLREGRMNWRGMTSPEYLAHTQQAHQELAAQNYMTPFEKEYICKDGSRLPVVVGAVVLPSNPSQHIAFVLDNSARKELEQRKDTFLGMVSHELKAPLASLKLQNQLLRKKLGKQDIASMEKACTLMEMQLNTITHLVDEILNFSRMQEGKLEYAQDRVDLDKLLREVADVIHSMQTTHTVVIHPAASPSSIIGDRNQLERLFLNVLSNAVKYAPNSPLVEVWFTPSAEAITISVRDQGIGIPQEAQEKIFERFYRAVPLQQRAFPGFGMGLYIVSEIVKHHKGTIRVESEKGKGSTFHITFPVSSL